jgi:hypothetical protein
MIALARIAPERVCIHGCMSAHRAPDKKRQNPEKIHFMYIYGMILLDKSLKTIFGVFGQIYSASEYDADLTGLAFPLPEYV